MEGRKRKEALSRARDARVDGMIEKLNEPRVAEQFRIWKVVEDQFLKIDEQVGTLKFLDFQELLSEF